jgi:uncharacterized membrane protein YhaH (DUF805 family)
MPVDPTDPDLPLYGASPLTAYSRFWRRSIVFSGRAGLSEFWWPVLLNVVIAVVIGLLGAILLVVGSGFADQGLGVSAVPDALGAVLLFALLLFFVAQLLPSISSTVRRLHDANLSGLYFLLTFVPSVGGLIVLVLTILPTNQEGRRFDRGAPAWRPVVPQPAVAAAPPPAAPPAANGGFDAWPAPAPAPATAPLPLQHPWDQPSDRGSATDEALLAAWGRLGTVERVEPRLGIQPSWRRQGYVLVRLPDGVDVLATNGLAASEGAAALGVGAEVYLAGADLGATPAVVADSWRFTIVAAVARRLGASGMHLPAELEQYGALSMTVPADAPADWRTPDGSVGVLIGVGLPGVPESVATAAGEVRLVGLTPLRPEELQRILDDGREARSTVASGLAALPPAQLVSLDRPAV